MNPTAVLGLISNLYEQIVVLQERNEVLSRALTEATSKENDEATPRATK